MYMRNLTKKTCSNVRKLFWFFNAFFARFTLPHERYSKTLTRCIHMYIYGSLYMYVLNGVLEAYTDAWKMRDETDCVMFIEGFCSVFQTEIMAILKVAAWLLDGLFLRKYERNFSGRKFFKIRKLFVAVFSAVHTLRWYAGQNSCITFPIF